MPVSKIILFYQFAPLPDPDAVRLWQRDLCEGLGLRGRILISSQGINGTLGGELNAVKKYLRKTREYGAFAELDVKWSEGTGFESSRAETGTGAQPEQTAVDASAARAASETLFSRDFPRLSVRVRDEIVSFGAPGELTVDENGVRGGGTRLSPHDLHELVESQKQRGDEVVFFDGRNRVEAEIGRFAGAVVPDVDTTREFVAELDSGKYDHLKSRPVVTYCTGGIRCEVLSSLMAARGFENVYQLDGGIVRYGETFGDSGLWQGSLYVFDKRGSVDFTPDARAIASCNLCQASTSRLQNCADPSCREQLVVCATCATDSSPRCTAHHTEVAQTTPSV